MNDLEFWGTWLLPHKRDDRVFGQLTFSNSSGLSLKLHGAFQPSDFKETIDEYNMDRPRIRYPIILGVTTENKLETLYDCTRVGSTTHFGQNTQDQVLTVFEEQYHVEFMFLDVHFLNPAELKFHKVDIHFRDFAYWAGLSGFHMDWLHDEQGHLQKFDLSFEYPDIVEGYVTDGKILVTSSFHGSFHHPLKPSVSQTTYMQIELRSALTVSYWLSDYVYYIQNLLSLATTKPHPVTNLFAYSKGKTEKLPDGRSKEIKIPVVFRQRYYWPRREENSHPGCMLFSLKDIKDEFGDMLRRWRQISDPKEFGGICDLFFSIIYSPSIYLPHEFLNVVIAAESYHRRRFNRTALPTDEFNKRKDTIINSVPEECQDWITGQFQFRNDLPFPQRIGDMIDFSAPVVMPLIANKDYFIDKVKNTRNFLAHNIRELEDKAAQGLELRWITQTLTYMIHTCLLAELGISPERCAELFPRHEDYGPTMKLALKFTTEEFTER